MQSSLWDLANLGSIPGVKTPGYWQALLRSVGGQECPPYMFLPEDFEGELELARVVG